MSLIEEAKILLEEYKLITELWKFNRDLALKRFQINFLINSAIMTAAATVAAIFWEQGSFIGPATLYVISTAFLGVVLSSVWYLSGRRHHQYIYLKMKQGVEREQRLSDLVKTPTLRMFQETRDLLAPKGEGGKGCVRIADEEIKLKQSEKYSSSWVAGYVPFVFIIFWGAFALVFLFSRP